MANPEKGDCFVVSPIGARGSEVRQRSDQVLDKLIRPVIASTGYNLLRADHIAEPGLITNQMIAYLANAPIVIADLSGHNPNVFYELAVRHSLRKPVIQLIDENERLPFDVAGTRTIQFSIDNEESVEEARRELAFQISAIENRKFDAETPLSIGLRSILENRSGLIGTLGQVANLPSIHFFSNVNEVYPALYQCCEKAYEETGAVTIQNIGLDWGTAWFRYQYDLLNRTADLAWTRNARILGLVVDPDRDEISRHCKAQISPTLLKATIPTIQSYFEKNAGRLRQSGIQLQLKKYSALPVIHGFDVNQQYLFVSTTIFEEGELTGGDDVYHFCVRDPTQPVIENYFRTYLSWFRFWWDDSGDLFAFGT